MLFGDSYAAVVASDPLPDDSVGHSFIYVPSAAAFDRPVPVNAMLSDSSFFSLSGAAISANLATSASMPSIRLFNELTWPSPSACTFESSRSFAAVPLLAAPAPPRLSTSGPLLSMSSRFSETSGSLSTISGPLSDGPFLSGALNRSMSTSTGTGRPQPSASQLIAESRPACSSRRKDQSLLGYFVRTASKLSFRSSPRLVRQMNEPAETTNISIGHGDNRSPPNGNVEWAQSVVGEDRFHVAVSEEHGWVFVGIYDGFNGPDGADYLFANLYVAVHNELKGVLWDDIHGGDGAGCSLQEPAPYNEEDLSFTQAVAGGTEAKRRRSVPRKATAVHRDILRALARALKKTEDAFFEAAEQRAAQRPELGMMGSCVLVMVMTDTDVYVMNVGDSRVVLARTSKPDLDILGKASQDLEQFKAEVMRELEKRDRYGLRDLQLTREHSTANEEEVRRIKNQHLNDPDAILYNRVKGKLSVTRAFGVGCLKQPKWNDRMLGVFKINFVGTDPYVSCTPSLCHHRISSQDRFLVLSSDGLYQYFTNKEVVDHVEAFAAQYPDGDPAKHRVSELVLRAARKARMPSHELLDIEQCYRRRYHDDVSVIVISFEGKIRRSSF